MLKISFRALLWGFLAALAAFVAVAAISMVLASVLGISDLRAVAAQLNQQSATAFTKVTIWGSVTLLVFFVAQLIPGMVVAKRSYAGFEYRNAVLLALIWALIPIGKMALNLRTVEHILFAFLYFATAFSLGVLVYLKRHTKEGQNNRLASLPS
jgi:hypothetical protein